MLVTVQDVPILNGGDGAGHHPTQTMLDLFTIRQAHGTLEGLNVVLAGDFDMVELFTLYLTHWFDLDAM